MPSTRATLLADLRALGLRAGATIMVHASVRSAGPIVGGATTLVQALLDAVGEEGTLVSYVDWETGFPEIFDPAHEADIPAFDKRIARAARAYGILPEVIRTWPGAIRSDNPDAGVAAVGRLAAWLCADHALSYGYGENSPYAKLVEIDAGVLMLGAPLDTITLLHHAEHAARLEGKRLRRYRRKLLDGGATRWVDIEEFDTCDPVVAGLPADAFARIAEEVLREGTVRRGAVGGADSSLFSASELHGKGVRWLETWQRVRSVTVPERRGR